MEGFLETYKLRRLNQGEREKLQRTITGNEIESAIKNHPKQKSPGPDGFNDKFYQIVKEKLTLVFLKLFQKMERETSCIILIPKPKKDTTIKEN